MTEFGLENAPPSRQLRGRLMEKMEKLVAIWLEDLQIRNFPVSLVQIQEKSRRLYSAIKENLKDKTEDEIKHKFTASKGWFHRFQKRRGLHSVNLKGEAASADVEAARVYPAEFQKIIREGNYLPSQVYNVDETGLYYKMPPSKTYVSDVNRANCAGTKILKDRVTVLLGGNMAGDKLKPFLLHKYKNPRCLKNVNRKKLPVIYRSNRKAWMTAESFTDWYKNFFLGDAKKKCKARNVDFKVLLIVDNAPSHPDFSEINPNVKVIFLPPNTTSLLQPMDMGVISIAKTNYKYELLESALRAAEKSSKLTLLTFLKSLSIKDAIEFFGRAWESVPKSAMEGVWHKLLNEEQDLTKKPESLQQSKIQEIIKLGTKLGMNNLDNLEVKDSISFEEDDLSVEELLTLDDPEPNLDGTIDDLPEIIVDLEKKELKTKNVQKALSLLIESQEILCENDPDDERLLAFNKHINAAKNIYNNVLKERSKNSKQKEIGNFFSKN